MEQGADKTPLGDWTTRALDLALALFVSGAALAVLGELALTVLGS